MKHTQTFLLAVALLCLRPLQAQIVINELSNRNATQVVDEDGDYEDWIELYNTGPDPINLEGYGLTDQSDDLFSWILPDIDLLPNQHLLVFASGKDRVPGIAVDHWESVIGESTNWSYRIPNAGTSSSWNTIGFDAGSWPTGMASIGYGDGDDVTSVPSGTISVFLRYKFDIDDTSRVADAFLHMDFDDGFVAFLNGEKIAQYGFPGALPAYNDFSGMDHEAAMYSGGLPTGWLLEEAYLKTLLVEGENVLAVEVHNVNAGSSDLTCLPFLTIGFKDPEVTFSDPPAWFDLSTGVTNLHTDYKISGDGETIYLTEPATLVVDSMYIGYTFYDQSFGRDTDGAATTGIFTMSTPGYSNDGLTTYSGYSDTPIFDLSAGFYDGPQTVGITCPNPDDAIYYTLDGNTPGPTDILFTTPLNLSQTSTIRATCLSDDAGLLPGYIATNTYFIDEETELAVFSITTDEENLYGWTGIFDNWWTDWKRPCYIEYFDTSHAPILEQYSGVKVDGGAGGSRSLDQKSMRLEPDHTAFGDGLVEFPINPRFPERDTWETFYLRNGSNMWNVLPYKDAFMVRTTEGTHVEHMAYAPVEVWLNGEYWGLYELREKLDEGHFQHTHLIDKQDQDVLSVSYWYGLVLRTLQGSADEWMEMVDYLYTYPSPTDADFWEVADSVLNLVDFTDYMIAECWFANLDWPYNNIKIWRDHGGDNQWKYAVIDVELGLGYAWSDVSTDLIDIVLNDYNYYTSPFLSLIQNERYKNYFINRFADLMNTTFLPERTFAMEDSIYQQVAPAMPRQLERWGTGASISSQMATFEDYREALMDDFEVRSLYVRNHIWNNFDLNEKVDIEINIEPEGAGRVHLNTIDIYDPTWEGVYFDGVPVTMTAIPFTGFTFDQWGESPYITDISSDQFTVNFDDDGSVTAYFTGSPQETTIAISELNYHSEPTIDAGNWIEIWNYGDYTIHLDNWMVQDDEPLHEFYIPYGISLAPDERLVLVSDLEAFTAIHPDVTQMVGPIGFNLGNAADAVYLFNDRSELVAQVQYTDDYPWPQGPNGEGRTLERLDPTLDPNLPSAWFDGCIGGSPGQAYTPCGEPLVISEVNYNSAAAWDSDDWFELRNVSYDAIDISGWSFMDNDASLVEAYTIPDGTIIEAGQNLVLAQTDWKFESVYPDVVPLEGSFFFSLDGNNDWIRGYDEEGILQISLHYFDALPWPEEADGLGYTLELVDSTGKMNAAENWMIGCEGGSPGEYLVLPCNVPDQIAGYIDYSFSVYPNPAHDHLVIQMANHDNWTGRLLDVHGKEMSVASFTGQSFYWQLPALPTGTYTLSLLSAHETLTKLLIIQ